MLGLQTTEHRFQRANAPEVALADPPPDAAPQHHLKVQASNPGLQATRQASDRLPSPATMVSGRRCRRCARAAGRAASIRSSHARPRISSSRGASIPQAALNQPRDDLAAPIPFGHQHLGASSAQIEQVAPLTIKNLPVLGTDARLFQGQQLPNVVLVQIAPDEPLAAAMLGSDRRRRRHQPWGRPRSGHGVAVESPFPAAHPIAACPVNRNAPASCGCGRSGH